MNTLKGIIIAPFIALFLTFQGVGYSDSRDELSLVTNSGYKHNSNGVYQGPLQTNSTRVSAEVKETPKPVVVPVVQAVATFKPVPRTSYDALIELAAAKYGADPVWMKRVMMCESGGNPNAYNPGGPTGLFQFMPRTFAATPYGHRSIWDPEAQIYAAAWKYSQGGAGAWSCK